MTGIIQGNGGRGFSRGGASSAAMISRRGLTGGFLTAGLASRAAAQPAESVMARVARTGIMRVGAVNAQPPYCYKEAGSGAWAGFMIDIARDLATEQKATIEPVESTWGNAVLDVLSGKVDIFFGLAPTPQRTLVVDFSKPLFENAFSLIARTGFAPRLWQDLNTPDVRIAIELGTVYDQNVGNLCPKATITRLKTNNDALMTVQAGHADCLIIVVILALTALARNPALGHLVVPEPLFSSSTSVIMAKEANPLWRDTVNEWITRRRAAGQLREVLVANLEKVGVRAADVPPQLLF